MHPPQPTARPSAERFRAFFEQYKGSIWATLRAVNYRNTPEAEVEDQAQRVLLVAHDGLAAFTGNPAQLSAWVRAICLRVAQNARRTIRRRRESGEEPEEARCDESRLGPDDATDAKRQLVAFLAGMKPGLREVFEMYHLSNLSSREIAALLDVSSRAVERRLVLAQGAFDKAFPSAKQARASRENARATTEKEHEGTGSPAGSRQRHSLEDP